MFEEKLDYVIYDILRDGAIYRITYKKEYDEKFLPHLPTDFHHAQYKIESITPEIVVLSVYPVIYDKDGTPFDLRSEVEREQVIGEVEPGDIVVSGTSDRFLGWIFVRPQDVDEDFNILV